MSLYILNVVTPQVQHLQQLHFHLLLVCVGAAVQSAELLGEDEYRAANSHRSVAVEAMTAMHDSNKNTKVKQGFQYLYVDTDTHPLLCHSNCVSLAVSVT